MKGNGAAHRGNVVGALVGETGGAAGEISENIAGVAASAPAHGDRCANERRHQRALGMARGNRHQHRAAPAAKWRRRISA